jgi:hypothetical protein
MRKLLLLLFVTALFQVNAQYEVSNSVSNVLIVESYDHIGIENAISVPQGKFWIINPENNIYNVWRVKFPEMTANYLLSQVAQFVLPENTQLFLGENQSPNLGYVLNILEYNYNSTDEELGFNDVEPLKDRIKLFPNPTTNELALNSDKVYQIEVFDLTGNKVMEFKGNTISVEHLSNATYIVNAIDLETKERLSYKVIKK